MKDNVAAVVSLHERSDACYRTVAQHLPSSNDEKTRISVELWSNVWAVGIEQPAEDVIFLRSDLYDRQHQRVESGSASTYGFPLLQDLRSPFDVLNEWFGTG